MTNPTLYQLLKDFEASYNLSEPLTEKEKQDLRMRLIELITII